MIEDALGLFLGPGQSTHGYHGDPGCDVHLGFEGFFDEFACLFEADTSLRFCGDEDHVLVDLVIMGDVDVVIAGYAVDLAQQLFYLAGEHVHAVYLEHVIASATDDVQSGIFGSAGALPGNDAGQVVGPETKEGCPFLYQGGDNDLAFLSVFHVLSGDGIDDLDIEIIIPHPF